MKPCKAVFILSKPYYGKVKNTRAEQDVLECLLLQISGFSNVKKDFAND